MLDKFVKQFYFFSFKTSPERLFVGKLVEKQNTELINGWIKSPDVGFYSIEYYWRKGEHHKKGFF